MRNKNKNSLWSKNFTIITLGTVISAIGSSAITFAFSFVVFDNSQSTLWSGMFAAISMLPGVLLPILISPWLDRIKRLPVIVGLDAFNGMLYLAFGLFLLDAEFNYFLYLGFNLIVNATGAIYNLAYTSFYPNLIPEGQKQKGYTISGMIYPTVTVVVSPAASVLYKYTGTAALCIIEGILLLGAAMIERMICVDEHVHKETKFTLSAYLNDLMAAFTFLKKEKGLVRIYAYMPITNGLSEGYTQLVIAWFQTTPGLGITLYSFLTGAEFLGRTIGGLVHYKFTIPENKRFSFAYFVYQIYNIMDMLLLWSGYPLMLLNRAACGFLGINSATLRESSVQTYIPDKMRARVNALFSVMMSVAAMFFRVFAGWLGELLSYRGAVTICGFCCVIVCYLLIYRGQLYTRPVYNRS